MTVTKYPVTVSSLSAMLSFPRWHAKDATGLKKVIVCFGHGGNSLQMMQSTGSGGGLLGNHATYFASQGCVVASIDYGGTSFLNPTSIANLVALDDYLNSIGAAGRALVFAHSMGGGAALRFAQENPARVDALYLNSPLTDLDYFHANATYTAEIDAAYANAYAANGSPRSPIANAAAFAGLPIRIVHPTDDPTVPYAHSTAFIAAVGGQAISLRQPDILGGHNGGMLNISPSESWEWLRTHRT